MNRLIRWSLTLGLIINPVANLSLMLPAPVWALPQADIVKFLGGIPVYSVLNRQGSPIGQQLENGSVVTPVFMSRIEAKAFLEQLETQDPELARSYAIEMLPLSRIYEIARGTANSSTRLFIEFIPSGRELQAARQLTRENGQKYPGNVPLYIAKLDSDQSYLTIKQDGEEIVPLFFEKATVQKWVDAISQAQPSLAPNIKIQVISLSGLIANLENNDNPLLRSLRFWPSQEMLQIIRSNSQER
ncbi:MAG: Tic22 family protein [Crocosphaera sp.]